MDSFVSTNSEVNKEGDLYQYLDSYSEWQLTGELENFEIKFGKLCLKWLKIAILSSVLLLWLRDSNLSEIVRVWSLCAFWNKIFRSAFDCAFYILRPKLGGALSGLMSCRGKLLWIKSFAPKLSLMLFKLIFEAFFSLVSLAF